jgi:DNA gyrase subunit A
VLNNLYKHTQLQDNFGSNMLAIVDGVPRTLTLDLFVSHWIKHQHDVIVRRTRFRLRKAEERAHILRGLLKAIDRIDEVIAFIRRSKSAAEAMVGLQALLEIDELQARAILDMQLRKLAALERQELQDEYDGLMLMVEEYLAILASEDRQRQIIREELDAIVQKHGDDRRSRFVADEGEMREEDLIAERDIVVTITAGGYAKRTHTDLYREQRRGGKGIKGAALKQDDVVNHFFITTTHHWLLFFTNRGRVYRIKAYELPEAGRDARGQHVANLLALQADESITQVLDLRDYEQSEFLVLATRGGMVKKTRLTEYDSSRTGGVIAINLREEDELVSAQLVGGSDDLMLISRKGYSVRFTADEGSLRSMGRSTSGVIGMRFKTGDDELLAMDVVRPGAYVVTVTDGGYAKRTIVEEWNAKGRGTQGVRAMKLVENRGGLVGALIADEADQIFAIASNGIVIRTRVDQIRSTSRDTMGVSLMNLGQDETLIAVARAGESDVDDEEELVEGEPVESTETPDTEADTVTSEEA